MRVTVTGPDSLETPVSELAIIALPYNRDSIIQALESAAAGPRPHVAELDSLFAIFREPFVSYSAASMAERQLEDTLAALGAVLDTLPRNREEYRALYTRYTALHDSLPGVTARREELRERLGQVRSRVNPRIDSLRREVVQWENTTFASYEQETEAAARRSGKTPSQQITDATGWATFQLEGEDWWIYARAWDATDPNAQWYWNVPVTGDTVRLSSENGERRPRY